ncbi:hypothetical protein BP6252_05323 [Coleophoma cylindrospora]|uniref:Uncharacterized protein n=1 Tax=Coleophoma cylindrospora TaxID=1849047 RepID=A0A3D8RTI8_9HELO|nr:hypothetical protein BP6252_05323 [Coleophoma cylindrospora]
MVNLIDLINQKLELFRLEQRYTRRRNRRSTFVSEAEYVNGEYIYSPTSSYSAQVTGNSSKSGSSTDTADTSNNAGEPEKKLSRRLSKMAMGGLDWRQGSPRKQNKKEEGRRSKVSVREIHWDGGVRSRDD